MLDVRQLRYFVAVAEYLHFTGRQTTCTSLSQRSALK